MNAAKIALTASVTLILSACLFDFPDPTVDLTRIALNDRAVHDPAIVSTADGYYVFGSHLAAARSTDLMNWQYIANGVDPSNPLYSTIPVAGTAWTGIPGSWAADVIKLKDGKYYFYYSFCGVPPTGVCNAPRAYLGVAVSDNIGGPYIDKGIFLRSGMTPAEIAAGLGPEGVTSYDPRVQPNTIDPNPFYDKTGKLWMLYGSYSGGPFVLQMDESTGKPMPGQGYGKHVAGGDHAPIEGGYVLYSPETRYYYLFASFGGLAANDGYNIRIARSRNPDGPYTGPYASAVRWESSDPTVISTTGKVTRPGRDAPDAEVILTATVTLNGLQTIRSFTVTVKSLAPPTPVAAYSFEDTLDDSTGAQPPGSVVGARINEAGGVVSFAAGSVGRALVLNGASGVRLPENLINDHSYSISVWLGPTAVSQFTPAFFGWASDTSWISLVPRGPGGAQNTMLWSGTNWFDGTFNSQIPVAAWSHLVAVVNNGALAVYLNGQLANSMTGFPDVFTPRQPRVFHSA